MNSRTQIPLFNFPVRDWFLYSFTVASPLIMYSVLFSRDTVAFWIIVLMSLFILIELMKTGGYFWVDRTFLYLVLFFGIYALWTLHIFFNDIPTTWLGRTPLDRAAGIDLRLFYCIAAFILFSNLLADADIRVFLKILKIQLYSGAFIASFGILQYLAFAMFGTDVFTEIEPTNETFSTTGYYIMKIGREYAFRATSIFNEPSWFGFFLVPLVVKSVIAWNNRIILHSKIVHLFLIFIFLAAVFINFSLTAIISLALLLPFFLIWVLLRKRQYFNITVIITSLLLILIVLSPLGGILITRLESIASVKDLSAVDRLVRVYTSVEVLFKNIWLGVGPGGYAFYYPRMGGLDFTTMVTPLNIWLGFLTDVGILGIVPIGVFLITVVIRAIKNSARNELISIYLWSVISYLIVLSTLDAWYVEMFWFEIAILLCLSVGPNSGSVASVGPYRSS